MINGGNGVRESRGKVINRASIFVREGSGGSIIGALNLVSNSIDRNSSFFNNDGGLFDVNNNTDDGSRDGGNRWIKKGRRKGGKYLLFTKQKGLILESENRFFL